MKFKNFALFYVHLILDGKCTFDDVPKRLKPYVKQVAIDLGVWDVISGGEAGEGDKATPSNV